MGWYKLELSGEDTQREMRLLQGYFQSLQFVMDDPEELAVFTKDISPTEQIIYASTAEIPEAVDRMVSSGGVPCEKPSRSDLSASLVGMNDPWKLLNNQ